MRKVKRNLKKCENLEYWVGRREDGFGEGQAVAGSIISKFSSQPVTAVDNEDDEDTVLMMSKQVASCIIFNIFPLLVAF